MLERFFASCPRGLENILAGELHQLHATDVRSTAGGVGFSGDFFLSYLANVHSRLASRILWQRGSGNYRSEGDLYQAAHALAWPDWFDASLNFMVKVTAHQCPLRSLDYLTLKVKDAVCDRFRSACGKRPNVNTVRPDMQIHVYLDSNSYIFYLDTTGPALFHRSDHRSKVDAPLRENLAAGILHLCNWVPPTPLLDPMCGGGTLLIEAAQLALNIAPGLGRRFAFEKMANHDVSVFGQILEDARRVQLPLTRLPLFGSDKYGKALHEARENLAAAGLLEAVHLKQADILEISPPAEKGILLTNPPYGVRSSDHETLAVFYPRLGEVLKKKFTGWRACILTADTRLPRLIRLKPSRRIPLFNGALECRLYEFKLVAGSMRRVKTDV